MCASLHQQTFLLTEVNVREVENIEKLWTAGRETRCGETELLQQFHFVTTTLTRMMIIVIPCNNNTINEQQR